MAERIRLRPYIVVTSMITMLHSISAHWVWSHDGFLHQMGTVDAAGCSVVGKSIVSHKNREYPPSPHHYH